MIRNAFFMRPNDRVGNKTTFQGITYEPELDDPDYLKKIYRNKDYFHFIVSDLMSDHLETKSVDNIIEFDIVGLRSYFMANTLNNEAFFDDDSNDSELDTTDQTFDFVESYLSYTPKPIIEEVPDD